MARVPDGYMESNRGLTAGSIITERRFRPFIADDDSGWQWDFKMETVHFKILELYHNEYKCRYIDTEENDEFYWPFWDTQPNYGFWIDACSPVRYYAKDT